MSPALQQPGVEQTRQIIGADRAVTDPASRRGYFYQRLKPKQSARTVAYQLHGLPTHSTFGNDRSRHFIGADRDGGTITGNEDLG